MVKRRQIAPHTGEILDETAPKTFTPTTFTKPDGTAMDFNTVVSSGLSVGVPGTPALWDLAARDFGTRRLADLLAPAERLARTGFTVDQTYHDQTAQNADRFAKFPATAKVFLPGGKPPAVGSVFTNPDMAKAYAELRRKGVNALYQGALGADLVAEARAPHTADGVSVMGGQITRADLADYNALKKAPVHSTYEGLDVYGMPVPSSGGIAVAEILNLMRDYELRTGTKTSEASNVDYLHRFSEASATAFADRNRYVGDVPGVPVAELTSKGFAGERSCLFDPDKAQPRPIPFGSPDGSYTTCAQGTTAQGEPREGLSTTHLTTTDKWGNVASYTLTIEQTGGSAITVPGWGFLLNNELTDFSFVPLTAGVPDPNLPGAGKRPRSSMSPTIVLKDDRPWLAARLARRRDDHHLGGADPARLPRPRPVPGRRHRRAAAVLAQRQGRGRRAGAAELVGRRCAPGPWTRPRRAHGGAAGDRRRHRDPQLQPTPRPGGRRAGTTRRWLSDGRAPLG